MAPAGAQGGVYVLLAGVVLSVALGSGASGPDRGVGWERWSDEAFARARREQRFVLLDVGAEWCHWCHVMDDTTYRDGEVLRLIRERYIPVRVDADAQPDLGNRYEDYGWPATVIFDAEGRELVKFRGYIPPPRMRSVLAGVIEDPTPGPSVMERTPIGDVPDTTPAHLPAAFRVELESLHASRYDEEHGGWGFVHKYLDADAIEYSLRRGAAGDLANERRARETLAKVAKHLIDPVWGGLYQYSDGGVWENPHFEKIMSFQANGLRTYSLAYARWREPAYLESAKAILRYLRGFLRGPQGAFFPSQDADVVPGKHSADYFALDDAARRRIGLPRIDPHIYTRENAWAVSALLAYHRATGDPGAREDAQKAARFIVAERSLPDGGYRHDRQDPGGPYLGDTVAAGRAFLDLFAASGEREWLVRAEDAAGFIDRTFRARGLAGFVTAKPAHAFDRPRPQRDENVAVARFGAALARATGRPGWLEMARHALRYLAAPAVARRSSVAAVLLAAEEVAETAVKSASALPN